MRNETANLGSGDREIGTSALIVRVERRDVDLSGAVAPGDLGTARKITGYLHQPWP